MSIPDLINGNFELLGTGAVGLSIRALLRSKKVEGFHYGTLLFFTTWGYWNLYYYPSLHQTLSTIGALGTVLSNTAYLALILKYR